MVEEEEQEMREMIMSLLSGKHNYAYMRIITHAIEKHIAYFFIQQNMMLCKYKCILFGIIDQLIISQMFS